MCRRHCLAAPGTRLRGDVAVAHGIGYAFIAPREIARALGDVMPVRAPPDPALVVALKKIPDQDTPLGPFIVLPALTRNRALRDVRCCDAIVSQRTASVNRKTLNRAKRNPFTRRSAERMRKRHSRAALCKRVREAALYRVCHRFLERGK